MSRIGQPEPRVHIPSPETTRAHSTNNAQPTPRVQPTSDTNTFTSTNTNNNNATVDTRVRSGLTRTVNAQPAPSSAHLQHSISQGTYAKRGRSGQSVSELQQMLNRSGIQPPLDTDGKFGPLTQQAVRDYQTQNNLRVDGIVGPETLGSLMGGQNPGGANGPRPVARPDRTQPNPAAPETQGPQGPQGPQAPGTEGFINGPGRVNSTFANSSAERVRQAEDILRSNGQWPPENGRAYAIQIDQDAPPASASRNDRSNFVRSYSGQTAVFRAENGRLVEQEGPLRSASHAGQFSSSLSPDVTGDGRGDVANIRPGVYHYNTRTNGRGRFNPRSNAEFANSARDYNQDGVIDGREAQGRHQATAIQIHAGNSSRPSSIGCQTLPPDDYNRFRQAIRGANTGGNSDFTYILVRRPNDQFGANPF